MIAITKLQKWQSISMIPLNNLKAHCDVVCIRRLLHNGPDTLEELLDRHLAKEQKPTLDDDGAELLNRRRLTSTRREALSLYRDILMASRFFTWTDSWGFLWRDILRENARKEFEAARFETNPEIVTRCFLVVKMLRNWLSKGSPRNIAKKLRRNVGMVEIDGDC